MTIKQEIIERVVHSNHRVEVKELMSDLSSSLGVPPPRVKRAMNELVFEHRLEFTFYGQSYIEAPLWWNFIPSRASIKNKEVSH
jgi:hypothetical protein